MEGAMSGLVSTVGQLAAGELWQLRGVGGKVAELRDELATMNALFLMQSEADEVAVDRFVREWMKQVHELAYDAEDCVDRYIFRVKCRSGVGFLVWSKRLLGTLLLRRRLAGDVKALQARAVVISERHARYGVSREALHRSACFAPVPAASASARALRPANDPGQFVGIRDQARRLAEKVAKATSNNQLKVFSIMGFGGLGKTTLTMEVCRQLESEFDRQAQVSVSQAFHGEKDLDGLLKRLLEQLVKPKEEKYINEEDSVGDFDNLDKLLTNKRYLIVIDDVWTMAAWDAIQSKLPDNNCDSRIIVTTRIETVARGCSHASIDEDCLYQIKPLNEEDSKKLFLIRAFGNTTSCPKQLKDAMGKILRKCGGLPLAIVSIASLLASYTSSENLDMWERVCGSIGSQMESNPTLEGMRQIITLSYNHLPHHLRACMMYLSIFPEDYVIMKKLLLNRWIAEGLVAEKRGMTLMEVAETYFDELVSRSMIDLTGDIYRNTGSGETCRVHDMMLEVMVSKSLEANFVSLVGGEYQGMSYDSTIRRLSVHGVEQGSEGMDVQHVRSLSMFELDGNKFIDRLGEFTLLRVLDLHDSKGLQDKHMRYICRMYLLRFLRLSGTDISEIPERVGELEHLQTLDVLDTCVRTLPATVAKLHKLERLLFTNKHEWTLFWMPPRGLSKMKALREVAKLGIKDDTQVAQDIGELVQLQELCIYVDCDKPTEELRKELATSLGKTSSLRWLNIAQTGYETNSLSFLLDIKSPPRLLRFLRIGGGIGKLPSWIGSLACLVEIHIAYSYLADNSLFDVLCKAPSLKNIHLGTSFCRGRVMVARTSHNFPALRSLILACSEGFPEAFIVEDGSMTKLEELSMDFHDRKKNTIAGIEHLRNLTEIRLHGRKSNPALKVALDQVKAENDGRSESERFKVAVRYSS